MAQIIRKSGILVSRIRKDLPFEKKIRIITRQQIKIRRFFEYIPSHIFDNLKKNNFFVDNGYHNIETNDKYEYLIFYRYNDKNFENKTDSKEYYELNRLFNGIGSTFNSKKIDKNDIYNGTYFNIIFYRNGIDIKIGSINLSYDYYHLNEIGFNKFIEFINKLTEDDGRISEIYSYILRKTTYENLFFKNITLANKYSRLCRFIKDIDKYEKLLDEEFIINQYDKSILMKIKALDASGKLNTFNSIKLETGFFTIQIKSRLKRDSENELPMIYIKYFGKSTACLWTEIEKPSYYTGMLCYLINNFSGGKNVIHKINEMLFNQRSV